MLDDCGGVPALRADTWDEDGHIGSDRAYLGQFAGIGSAHHQAAVAPLRPVVGHQSCDVGVDRLTIGDERLDVVTARVARTTEGDDPASVFEVRLDRVGAEVRIDGDGVGSVPLERLPGVVLGGGADVATLGVEDQCHVRIGLAHVLADALERPFRALAREVGDLWLERTHQVGSGVDDRLAERLGRVVGAVERRRHPRRVGIEADAEHRPRRAP